MKPLLVNIGCFDAPNLRGYAPEDPEDIATHVFLDIGRRGQKGTTQFTIFLATPKGLSHLEPADSNIIKSGRMVIVTSYEFDSIWRWFGERVEECEATTWNEVLDNLRNRFDWEHEYSRER